MARLPATPTTIVPCAVYMGHVYTQEVRVAVDADLARAGREAETTDRSGPVEVTLFDPEMALAPDLLGESVRVEPWLFGAELSAPAGPDGVAAGTADDRTVELTGSVAAVDRDDQSVAVAVGDRQFEVELAADEAPSVAVGDRVTLSASAHLRSIDDGDGDGDRDPRAALEEQLTEGSAGERADAARYLGRRWPDDAVGALATAAREDPDPAVRRQAVRALGWAGRHQEVCGAGADPRIADAVLAATEDVDPVRRAAERARHELRECPNEERVGPFEL